MGLYAEAISSLKKSIELAGPNQHFLSNLARSYAFAGQKHRALEILADLQSHYKVKPQLLSGIYLALEDKEKALDLLEEDFDQNPAHFYAIKVNPPLDPLRSEPRFQELVRRFEQFVSDKSRE